MDLEYKEYYSEFKNIESEFFKIDTSDMISLELLIEKVEYFYIVVENKDDLLKNTARFFISLFNNLILCNIKKENKIKEIIGELFELIEKYFTNEIKNDTYESGLNELEKKLSKNESKNYRYDIFNKDNGNLISNSLMELLSDKELIDGFIEETVDIIKNINSTIENSLTNNKRIDLETVKRGYHTVKGSSGFLNLQHIYKISEELEELVFKHIEEDIMLSLETIKRLENLN